MSKKQRQLTAATVAVLLVGIGLWVFLRGRLDDADIQTTRQDRSDLEPVGSTTRDSAHQPNPSREPTPSRDDAETEWRVSLESISSDDLVERSKRRDRRINAFFVQQRLEEVGIDFHQSQALRDLMIRSFSFERDFRARMESQGVSEGSSEFDRLRLQEKAELDRQIETLVGSDRAPEITNNTHKATLRLYAIEMAGEAALQGVPLTASQRHVLNTALNQLDATRPRAKPSDPADPGLGANLYDMKVFIALEGVLSERQLQLFQDTRYEEHLYREAERRIEAKKFGIDGGR